MSHDGDEHDLELLELLRQTLATNTNTAAAPPPDTGVLQSAEWVYNNALDVALDMRSCKAAAAHIYHQMQLKNYSTASWHDCELHPRPPNRLDHSNGGNDGDGDDSDDDGEVGEVGEVGYGRVGNAVVDFIFTMDLLNFSFWSERPDNERFAVEYRGKRWTGYWSLVAAIQRALEDGIPITSSDFWQSEEKCTLDVLKHVFRSCTEEEMPMLEERLACLQEAGKVLHERYSCSASKLVQSAGKSAARLVNILASEFPCFNDVHSFPGRKSPVRILKRAQIFVADLWACFDSSGPGQFDDIAKLTMFADYRIPQILNIMGCISYSPPLASAIARGSILESGSVKEVELRACSIWCVELIRREILRLNPKAEINAVLMDFFLYDRMKELEAEGHEAVKHHRTRSIWY